MLFVVLFAKLDFVEAGSHWLRKEIAMINELRDQRSGKLLTLYDESEEEKSDLLERGFDYQT